VFLIPRRKLVITDKFPYHVTARSNNKEFFYLPIRTVWEIFCEKLIENSARYGTVIHTFVLMTNHFHMVLTTPYADLGSAMRHLLTEVSKAIQRRSDRINHVFGARYKWNVLHDAYGVAYVYKYVLRNPVRGGLCPLVEDYAYSSLNVFEEGANPPVACGTDRIWRLVPKDMTKQVAWLNQPVPKELETLITNGLRREVFAFTKSNEQRKALSELTALYGVGVPRDRYLLGPEGD